MPGGQFYVAGKNGGGIFQLVKKTPDPSYNPPEGDNVNFVFPPGYSVPPNDEVDFDFDA